MKVQTRLCLAGRIDAAAVLSSYWRNGTADASLLLMVGVGPSGCSPAGSVQSRRPESLDRADRVGQTRIAEESLKGKASSCRVSAMNCACRCRAWSPRWT